MVSTVADMREMVTVTKVPGVALPICARLQPWLTVSLQPAAVVGPEVSTGQLLAWAAPAEASMEVAAAGAKPHPVAVAARATAARQVSQTVEPQEVPEAWGLEVGVLQVVLPVVEEAAAVTLVAAAEVPTRIPAVSTPAAEAEVQAMQRQVQRF